MDTAFVIGNGESRPIFPIQDLKNKGIIYGCNAIYRDNPELCDHIVAVNQPMYEELKAWHDHNRPNLKIHGPEDISPWNYLCDGDKETDTPDNLKLYRMWRGGDIKKGNAIRTIDFSLNRGSGMSAVLMAAESGIKNVSHVGVRHTGIKAVGEGHSQQTAEQHVQEHNKLSVTHQHEGIPQVRVDVPAETDNPQTPQTPISISSTGRSTSRATHS